MKKCFLEVVGLEVKTKGYSKLKIGIEKLMKRALRDIEDEELKVSIVGILLKARELLDGKRPSS